MNLIKAGDHYSTNFSYTQTQVDQFAEVSGDHNPIHSNPEFAANTVFKRPIMHGMLSASIFSKVFGTEFPGEGTIYLGQQLQFKRPMFVDTQYTAEFSVMECDPIKHKATIETIIKDSLTGEVTLQGSAQVLNSNRI